MNNDQLENLKTIHLLIVNPVLNAMSAAMIMAYCDHIFKRSKQNFYNNPANTYSYRSLQALEEISIVEIAEALKTKKNIGINLSKKGEIIKHRHAISHPYTVVWRDKEMQKFHDENKYFNDFKAMIVWDIFKTIIGVLKKNNCQILFDDIVVKPEMATVFKTILDYSLKNQTEDSLSIEVVLFEKLQEFKSKFIDFVIEHK